MALAYRPSLDSPVELALPWIAFAGMVAAWAGRKFITRLFGILVAIGGWYFLVVGDDRWTMLSFALYGLAFIIDPPNLKVGVGLAAVISAIWTIASIGGPAWTLLIPVLVFVAASTIAYAIERIGRLTATQAQLIRELRSTREDLAVSERSRGALQERSRFAGEIHDTLAQGFTSIVLLARAAKRSGIEAAETLQAIEDTAQENLNTARRLVESTRPGELDNVSLPMAIERHLEASLPESIVGSFNQEGNAVALPGSVETLLLRSAQEGIRNAQVHANPERIEVNLSYSSESVRLVVLDDGDGFTHGEITDRGSLTGGQGLDALRRRAESLSGEVRLEPRAERGSQLTVTIPTEHTE